MHKGIARIGRARAFLRVNRQPPEYSSMLSIDPDANFAVHPGTVEVKTIAYGKCPNYWDPKFNKWRELL